MNGDVFFLTIEIENYSQFLGWLIFVCLMGTVLTGWLMLSVSRYFLTDKGERFSILQLQLPRSHQMYQELLLQLSNKTKTTVRLQLRIDLYFMPFFYGLLFFVGWYFYRTLGSLEAPRTAGLLLSWTPWIAWLLDIIENRLIAENLNTSTKTKTGFVFGFALLKWLSVIFLLGLIFFLLYYNL